MLPTTELEAAPTAALGDFASSVSALSTSVAAVLAGVLATTLKSGFSAPTKDARAALSKGTVDTFLEPENKAQLVDVLTSPPQSQVVIVVVVVVVVVVVPLPFL